MCLDPSFELTHIHHVFWTWSIVLSQIKDQAGVPGISLFHWLDICSMGVCFTDFVPSYTSYGIVIGKPISAYNVNLWTAYGWLVFEKKQLPMVTSSQIHIFDQQLPHHFPLVFDHIL